MDAPSALKGDGAELFKGAPFEARQRAKEPVSVDPRRVTIRKFESDGVAADLEDLVNKEFFGRVGLDVFEPLNRALMSLALCTRTKPSKHAMGVARAYAVFPDDLEALRPLGCMDFDRLYRLAHRLPRKPIISWITDSLISAISASSRSRSIQSSQPRMMRRPSRREKSSSTSSSHILHTGIV